MRCVKARDVGCVAHAALLHITRMEGEGDQAHGSSGNRRGIRIRRRGTAAPFAETPADRGSPGDVGAAGGTVRARGAPESTRPYHAALHPAPGTRALRSADPGPAPRL